MDFPPVEWVDGDFRRAREFTLIELALIGVGILIVAIPLWVSFRGQLGTLSTPSPLVSLAFVLFPLGVALGGFFAWRLPRRWTVVRRLGISPVELHLRYSFHRRRLPWSRVRWLDPTRIQVRQWGGSLEFLLTESQADRLRHFFQHGQPLPSSSRQGRSTAR